MCVTGKFLMLFKTGFKYLANKPRSLGCLTEVISGYGLGFSDVALCAKLHAGHPWAYFWNCSGYAKDDPPKSNLEHQSRRERP